MTQPLTITSGSMPTVHEPGQVTLKPGFGMATLLLDSSRLNLEPGRYSDAVTPAMSLFAFDAFRDKLAALEGGRFILPSDSHPALLGSPEDRWLAARLTDWADTRLLIRKATGAVPQGTVGIGDASGPPLNAVLGSFATTTDGLGNKPGINRENVRSL